MDYINISKGIGCFIAAFIYFHFFSKPFFDEKKEERLEKEGYSKSFIENFKLDDYVRDFRGKIVGYGFIIVGIVLIYLGLTKK
ncbi:hypothetical protein [Flavobacterium sp. 83]|uniref:hypothetical protein n=1 Tax=Flavobacterium sp. 83 TaxID=1131812 RepID=UPI00054FBF1B|nr:hypothetical protein [Flavobacterium sp. 83]